MRKSNIISAIIFILLGAYVLIEASTFPELGGDQVTGPEFFPSILAIILIGLSLILFLTSIGKKEDREMGFFNPIVFKTYLTILGLFAYILILNIMGFILSTIAILFILIRFYGMKSIPKLAIVSVVATFVLYGVFHLLLSVPLPTNIFLS